MVSALLRLGGAAAKMMECSCFARLTNCPTCGRRLRSAHELQHAVEIFTFSIGREYRGKQVRELLESKPGIAAAWAKTKASTPEMKLLATYGRFRKAQADLDAAAVAAGAAAPPRQGTPARRLAERSRGQRAAVEGAVRRKAAAAPLQWRPAPC